MKETRIWIVADRQYRGYERLRVKIMKISELLQRIDYTVLQGDLSDEVTGICHDNRMLQKGDAFICISGARFDTHTMAKELAKKAALLVVEKPVELEDGCKTAVVQVASTRDIVAALAAAFYGYPSEKVVCIGITGSKGKTTCTHMMADILRAAGYLTGTIGTNGAIMPAGCDHAVWGSDKYSCAPCNETPGYDCYELNNTTPDPMELQMYLAMMVKAGCTHVVLEVSSQGMKQKRVATVDFAYGVWTNIETGDHIGPNEHKDFEEYLYCKAMLLNQSRRAYVNCDDRHLDAFMKYVTLSDGSDGRTKQVFYYGEGEKADYRIGNLKKSQNGVLEAPGIEFTISGALDADIRVNLPGDFNMYNAAAAVAIAHDMGISTDIINKGLTHLRIRGRFDIVFNNGHFAVCVDFAHNGYSTRNHLEALREYHPKRIVCVFGADGNRSKYRRYEMGEASALLADLSIVTAGHNRYETFDQIFADIKIGIDKAQKEKAEPVSYLVIPNRKEAIRYAIEHAQEGDMITILGLGHESYQEENGVKTPHSDIQFAAQCCKECYPQG